MHIRLTLLLSCLSMALPLQAVADTRNQQVNTRDQQLVQELSQLLCRHLKDRDRFDVAIYRALADLVERDERFAVMMAKDQAASISEKAGGGAAELCPAETKVAIEGMPPTVRKAYGL